MITDRIAFLQGTGNDQEKIRLLCLPAMGLAGEKQQYKSKCGPDDHQTETCLIGGKTVHPDALQYITAPETVQHPADGRLQEGYPEYDPHVCYAGDRACQV